MELENIFAMRFRRFLERESEIGRNSVTASRRDREECRLGSDVIAVSFRSRRI